MDIDCSASSASVCSPFSAATALRFEHRAGFLFPSSSSAPSRLRTVSWKIRLTAAVLCPDDGAHIYCVLAFSQTKRKTVTTILNPRGRFGKKHQAPPTDQTSDRASKASSICESHLRRRPLSSSNHPPMVLPHSSYTYGNPAHSPNPARRWTRRREALRSLLIAGSPYGSRHGHPRAVILHWDGAIGPATADM